MKIKRVVLFFVMVFILFPSNVLAKVNSDFEQEYSFTKLVEEAKAQVAAGQRTKLESPVVYKMLWLAFTDVRYEGKSYIMTDEHNAHLKNVAKNFEQSIEKYTGGNIDIQIQLEYISEPLNVTKPAEKTYVWLDRETTKKYLESYKVRGNYETVLTFAQFEAASIGGMAYATKTKPDFGYGFVNCKLPWDIEAVAKKIPLSNKEAHKIKDYSEPTDLTTLRAIHEWIHTIEWFGGITGAAFPSADNAGNNGYEAYTKDLKVEWFSFYRDILAGKAKKSDGTLNGVYPKMWKLSLVTEAANETVYTICDSTTGKYLMINEDKSVTLSDNAQAAVTKWLIVRSPLNDSYQIISYNNTVLRLDVKNAWNANNTLVTGYQANPNYISAQTWDFLKKDDGSYIITSRMSDAGRGDSITRVLTFDDKLKITNPKENEDGSWIITAKNEGK